MAHDAATEQVYRECSDCGETKPLEDFWRKTTGPLGHEYRCKPCSTRRRREIHARADEDLLKRQRERARKRRIENPEKFRQYDARKKRNPRAEKAQQKVFFAVKRGDLVRPDSCSKCGREAQIEGHHDDYDKPLEVRWLCTRCHRREHDSPAPDTPPTGGEEN